MASVTGYTAARMKQIEDATVTDIEVDAAQHLIITKHDGTVVDAGDISAVAKLGVQDNDHTDLNLAGSGTLASPWVLTAKVKDNTVKAVLDPMYIGPGPAKVKFLPGNTLSTESYQWIGKFEAWGNRTVDMIRLGDTWKILGHANEEFFGGKISLEPYLANNISPYGSMQGVSANYYNEPRAQRLSSGIVVLSGLLGQVTAVTTGQVLFTLPPGYRPDFTMIFPIINSGQAKMISISANGEVRTEGAFVASSNDFFTIDGIAFPAAGVATWTNVTEFVNNWTNWTGYPARYWKDPWGLVWLTGLVTGGTKGGDIPMFKVPADHTPYLQTHNLASSDAGLGYVSAFPHNHATTALQRTVVTKGGMPAHTWLSLCGIRLVTPEAMTLGRWLHPNGRNGWGAQYNSAYPRLGLSRREDGLVVAQGLMAVGSMNSTQITQLQDWVAPAKTAVIPNIGGDAQRRFDLFGLLPPLDTPQPRGAIVANGTHNAWGSFDGLTWMVGD